MCLLRSSITALTLDPTWSAVQPFNQPINNHLAQISNYAFASTVFIYCLAMILFIGEFALLKSPQRIPVLVGAGVSTRPGANSDSVATYNPEEPGYIPPSAKKSLSSKLGQMGYNVAVVALIIHIIAMVLRGASTHRVPWGNMFEFINLACLAAEIIAIVFLRNKQLRTILVLALVTIVILLFIAGTYLYATAAPVVPALKSYWLVIHVSIISVASGVFLISGMGSVLIILVKEKSKFPESVQKVIVRFPTVDVLDKISYQTIKFAFPLFTIGVICGAIWAESAWGRYWGWDPKETASFITWFIYAAYLHARATAGWKKETIAWINILGFIAVLVNLFVINLVTSGLHSYAGLN